MQIMYFNNSKSILSIYIIGGMKKNKMVLPGNFKQKLVASSDYNYIKSMACLQQILFKIT